MTRTRNAAPILLALSVVIGISGEPILVLINGNVTFELKIDEIPKEITWKFNEDKVCEIDSTSDVCFSSYKGRANINKTNGFLTISNLQNNDTGKYTAEIHQPTVKEFTFQLEVLGNVSRPNITCNKGEYNATLFCETSGDNYTTLKWDQDEQSVPASYGRISLAIVKTRGSHYTCISSNRVSKAINIFAPEECFLKCRHSHIGLILAVFFMILIPVTAYGLIKALSKRRKEETPEAEKLMRDNNEPNNKVTEPLDDEDPNTNVTEPLYNNEPNTKVTEPLDNEDLNSNVTEPLYNNEPNTKVTEPLDNAELNTNLTAPLNNKGLNNEVTAPLTKCNKELNSKVTAPINTKESNSEEPGPSNTKEPNSEEPGPPKPARSFYNNEPKGERKSKLNQDNDLDNKTPSEEHSTTAAEEETDPGNPFNTNEDNKTPSEEPSCTTAEEETDPGNPFNTNEDMETAPQEPSCTTADENTDPGNPFNTIEGNKTPSEEHSTTTAEEETDPGNPFNTNEDNKTPLEEPSCTTAGNKTPPEEHSNTTADEKTDPGNPFTITKGEEHD